MLQPYVVWESCAPLLIVSMRLGLKTESSLTSELKCSMGWLVGSEIVCMMYEKRYVLVSYSFQRHIGQFPSILKVRIVHIAADMHRMSQVKAPCILCRFVHSYR